MEHQPEELLQAAHDLEKPMQRYLAWKQVVDRYDRGKHTILGKVMGKLKDGKESIDALKYRAFSDEEYQKFLDNWDEAERKMVKARIAYETRLNYFNALQSYFAFQREGMKRGVL